MIELVLPSDRSVRFGHRENLIDGALHPLPQGFQGATLSIDLGARQMPASVEALQVLRAGIDREGVETEAVGCDVEPVRFRLEIGERGLIALMSLDVTKLVDDRTFHLSGQDHSQRLAGVRPERVGRNIGEGDTVEVLEQRPVIVLVALLHAAPIEALGDDRIGYAEPEQLGVLHMAKMMRVEAKSAILRGLAITSEDRDSLGSANGANDVAQRYPTGSEVSRGVDDAGIPPFDQTSYRHEEQMIMRMEHLSGCEPLRRAVGRLRRHVLADQIFEFTRT